MSGFTAPRTQPTILPPRRPTMKGCWFHPKAQLHNCGSCRDAATK